MTDAMREFMQDDHISLRSWKDGEEPELLKQMDSKGVVRRTWHEMMAEFQPEALDLFFQRQTGWKPHEISSKEVEFVIVAIDVIVNWKNIDSHINAAFDHGATIQELMDVCVVCGNMMGPHYWNFGMSHLDTIVRERKKAGLPTPRDRATK